MIYKSLLASLAVSTCLTISAHAASPLVHLPLDGSVDNLGSTDAAKLYAPGDADQPTYVQGHFGQALSFGTGGVIAIPYEFDPKETPQATVTMWIKVETDLPYEREVFSLGPGDGLRLTVGGDEKMTMRSWTTYAHDKAIPVGEWVFVAGVVDNVAGTIRIYENDLAFDATGLDLKTPGSLAVSAPGEEDAQKYIFIGADDFNSGGKEIRPVAIDDVRLYGEAIGADGLNSIRFAGPSNDDETTVVAEDAVVADAGSEASDGSTSPSETTTTGTSLTQDVKRTIDPITPDTLAESDSSPENGAVDGPDVRTITESDPDLGNLVTDRIKATGGSTGIQVSEVPQSEKDLGNLVTDAIEASGEKAGIDISEVPQSEKDLGNLITDSIATKTDNQTDGANNSTEAEPSTTSEEPVIIRPGGPSFLSAISGKGADNIERIEIPNFINEIRWAEQTDRPCHIKIVSPDGRFLDWDYCTGYAGSTVKTKLKVKIVNSAGIGRIDICKSKMSDRMKGIKVVANSWTPDENGNYAPYMATYESANCGSWQRAVRCPSDTYATGLVVHSENTRGGVKSITGLQLVCRALDH